jgi:hypothetical protein
MRFDFGEAPAPRSFDAEVKVLNWVSGVDIVDGLDRLLRGVQSAINLSFVPLWNDPPLYIP